MRHSAESSAGDIIAYVVRHMGCEMCHAPYTEDTGWDVLHDETQVLLIATCQICRAEHAVTVFDQPPYFNLRRAAPVIPRAITRQDVDEWRHFLSEFSGDFTDLISRP